MRSVAIDPGPFECAQTPGYYYTIPPVAHIRSPRCFCGSSMLLYGGRREAFLDWICPNGDTCGHQARSPNANHPQGVA